MRPTVPLRSSPAAWASPVIIALTIYAYAHHLGPYPGDPSWNGYLARASDGLNFGLPLAAGFAAWTANRFARSKVRTNILAARSPIRIFWAHTWILFAAIGIGYAAIVAMQVAQAWPPPVAPDSLTLVTFLFMAAGAIALGYVLGTYFHVAIAFPIAVLGLYQWIVFPQMDGTNVSWRNLSGYSLYGCCSSIYTTAQPAAVLGPILVAVPVIIVAVLIIRYRWSVLLPGVAIFAAALVLANTVVAGTDALAREPRTVSLSCTGSAPTVCLLPEQAASSEGAALNAYLRQGYTAAASAGVGLPSRIESRMKLPKAADPLAVTPFFTGGTPTKDRVLNDYANALVTSLKCGRPTPTRSGVDPNAVAQYALAVTMGGNMDAVLPQLSIAPDASSPDTALTPSKVRELVGISTLTDAQNIAHTWLLTQTTCLRSNG